ncbi:MAG: DUF6470 family protein [Clostridia bacterium]|jgi:hypothetical protein|nr:DUF6470 family protein [Clostridia bacterium]
MEQLIQIKAIPMQVELKCTRARAEISTEKASYEMTRSRGSLSINHSYPRLRVDTYEARSSMNLKSVARSVQDFGKAGVQAAYEATSRTVQEGNMLMDISGNNNAIADIIYRRMQDTTETAMVFLPSVPAEINWESGDLSMKYETDRLSFDWRTNSNPQFEYTPADVQYIVKQYPKIEIQYVGGPNYIPPSADPNYDPETDAKLKLDVTA